MVFSYFDEEAKMEVMAWMAEVQGVEEGNGEKVQVVQTAEYPSAKAFLQSRPAGVYTCARAVASTEGSICLADVLVVWSFHLHRLAAGLKRVDETVDGYKLDRLTTTTEQLVFNVLTQWQSQEDSKGDGMLSVLWYRVDNKDYAVAVHICPMPQPKCLASTVLVHGDGRDNATCKHTQWIADRVPIEKHAAQVAEVRGSAIHEVVLSTPGPGGDRLLLEGLITNFYVVKDDKLFTASEGVLEGSTREMVLMACNDLSIPVVLEAPKLSERASWQAAFVTSAVRVVIDVTTLLCEEGEGENKILIETSIPSDTSGFTKKIRDQIFAQRMYLK